MSEKLRKTIHSYTMERKWCLLSCQFACRFDDLFSSESCGVREDVEKTTFDGCRYAHGFTFKF